MFLHYMTGATPINCDASETVVFYFIVLLSLLQEVEGNLNSVFSSYS